MKLHSKSLGQRVLSLYTAVTQQAEHITRPWLPLTGMGSGAAHREVTEEAGQEEEPAMKITLNIQGFCVLKPSAWD